MQMDKHIEIMKEMFTKNITDVNKIFKPQYAVDNSGGTSRAIAWGCLVSSPVIKYNYNDDGVIISYYGRTTCYLGDTDWFVDRYVECDGKVIVNDKYGY